MKKITIIVSILLAFLFSSCQMIEDNNTYTAKIKCCNYTNQNISIKAKTDYRPAVIKYLKKSIISQTKEPETIIDVSWVPGKKYVDIDGFTSSYKVDLNFCFENGKEISGIKEEDKRLDFIHDKNYEVTFAFVDSKLPEKIDFTNYSSEGLEKFWEKAQIVSDLYLRTLNEEKIIYKLDNYFYSFQGEEFLKIDETVKQVEQILAEENLLDENERTLLFKIIQ